MQSFFLGMISQIGMIFDPVQDENCRLALWISVNEAPEKTTKISLYIPAQVRLRSTVLSLRKEETAMPTPRINKNLSLLTDDIACARELNARNVRVLNTGDDRGHGVFAARDFLPGEIVVVGLIDRMEKSRTAYSIQLDWNVHALFQQPASLMNHSCDPNSAIVSNRFGAYDFMAINQISSGGEVTWDYATSEFESIAVQVCLCSSKNCRGVPGGFSKLPRDHPMLVSGFCAPYLSQQNPGQFPRKIGLFSKFVGS
ncbi:SET domain-containing protein-lysine N-methyltransferase [Mesorhizobium sp. M1252]|uniref:SET domain-containing protein-lysine N-methyltransferase n=1 Tax=Mesorhizobium sp. M1252 TaxID=2957073 RepID=UPI003337A29B